jgi:23S rRNA (cytidine2498-2'-O)-methyltransferase
MTGPVSKLLSLSSATGYLAPEGLESQLLAELSDIVYQHDRLIITKGPRRPSVWAEVIWDDLKIETIESIGDAARRLRAMHPLWYQYAPKFVRRSQLIADQLPNIKNKPVIFPAALPTRVLGGFSLLDEHTLASSSHTSSPCPLGQIQFEEWKVGPPSRAYLKIWEALLRLGIWPKPGDRCIELGASPGGWTWAIARLGADITAYDRADLAPHVANLPNVTTVKGDAFQATPDRVGEIDWLFSDIICYPDRLYKFLCQWLESGKCQNFVCTIKFQGSDHYDIIPKFQMIPGSKLVHLYHNKHELTWVFTKKYP